MVHLNHGAVDEARRTTAQAVRRLSRDAHGWQLVDGGIILLARGLPAGHASSGGLRGTHAHVGRTDGYVAARSLLTVAAGFTKPVSKLLLAFGGFANRSCRLDQRTKPDASVSKRTTWNGAPSIRPWISSFNGPSSINRFSRAVAWRAGISPHGYATG